MSETNSNAFGQIIDGAKIITGMEKRAFNGFFEHLGAVLTVAVPTVIINDRLRIKPAIKKLPQAQRDEFVSNVAGGSLTIGKA